MALIMKQVTVGLLVALGLLGGINAIRAQTSDYPNELIQRLRSPNVDVQERAKENILQDRAQLIAGLIQFLEDLDPDKVKAGQPSVVTAIEVLGGLRAVEAVDVLAKYLTFRATDEEIIRRIELPEEMYPAVGAFLKIGRPAIDPVIDALSESQNDDPVLFRNSVWIIVTVGELRGEGIRLARYHLNMLIKYEKDQKRRNAITRVIEYLDKIIQ